MNTNSCLDRLRQRFERANVSFEVIEHAPAYTAQEAAAASGVSGYSVAKGVVVIVDCRPHLCVLPAAESIDYEAIRSPLGAREVRLAREEEFAHLFPDCEAGTLPPLRMTADDLPVYIDEDLTTNEWIVFASGTPTAAIRMRTEDYLRLAEGRVMQFGSPERGIGRQRRRPAPTDWGRWAKRGATASGAVVAAVVGPRIIGKLLPNRTSRSFAIGATVGAAAAAFADPRAGARRRAVLRDRTRRTARRTSMTLGKRGRYMRGKMQGVRHNIRQVRDVLSS